MATTLTSLVRLKRQLKMAADYVAEDDYLNDLLAAASEEIRQYCRQDFDLAQFEEAYNGSGNRWLQLSQSPVKSVLSVSVGGSAVSESDGYGPGYILTDRALARVIGFWPEGFANCRVVYIAGYDVVPEDVQQACAHIAALRYRLREHMGMTAKANGAASDSYDTVDLPQSIKDMLNQYIEPDLVLPAISKKTAPPPSTP